MVDVSLIACPKCGGALVRRVRRAGLIERLLSVAYVYPFRCGQCFRRFRVLQWGVKYSRRVAE
jgi:predicted nucleic acid-binding Zn ribbon protein